MDSENKVHDTLKKCCQKHGSIPIIKKMKGFLLNNRFVIQLLTDLPIEDNVACENSLHNLK